MEVKIMIYTITILEKNFLDMKYYIMNLILETLFITVTI